MGTDLPWTGYDENAGGLNIEGEILRHTAAAIKAIPQKTQA